MKKHNLWVNSSRLFFFLLLVFNSLIINGKEQESSGNTTRDTFYLDPINATTDGSGSTADDPARKLPQNAVRKPGTVILYKRGIVIRGNFEVFSGNAEAPVEVGTYGTGEKPIFLGSLSLDSSQYWKRERENIWRYTKNLKTTPCANIVFNGSEYCGAMKWSKNNLQNQGDWFMVDTLNGSINWHDYLLLYSKNSPARFYKSIEYVPQGKFRTFSIKDSFIVIQDLNIRNVGTHGIQINGGHHITICNCDFSYIGGAVFSNRIGINGLWVRYGNALEIWRKGSYITIKNNRVYETYDAGFVAQGASGTGSIDSVVVENNIFWNNGFDNFDNSWGKSISRVYFENNTCVNAGGGWAYETEGRPRLSEFLPDTIGWHVFLDSYDESTIWIRNNIFYNAEDNKLVKVNKLPGTKWRGITLDYNCYYQEDKDDPIIQIENKSYLSKDFKIYQLNTGNDKHSIVANPLFINKQKNDFRLQSNSPCINNGDPSTGSNDIGAYVNACKSLQ